MYFQIVILMKQSNFPYQIVIFCSYQIVTFFVCKFSLQNCHFFVLTSSPIPKCHYQIVVTKLSPYQVGITKLSFPKIVTLPSWYFQIVISKLSLPNCPYQIDVPKNQPVKKEALLPLINIQLDKYNKKIILAREQVPSGI